MESIQIKGSLREKVGKSETRKLRKEGKVPCIIYGGEKSIHFSAYEKDFRNLIYTPNVYITNVDVDGKNYLTKLQDIQFHPVSDSILHVDFLEIVEDEKIKIGVPVRIIGFAAGIRSGGKLHTLIRRLKVKALVKDLPDDFEINIEDLELGMSIKVRDLDFKNIELLDPPGSVVCAVKLTRVSKGMELEEAEVEEDTEGVEGEGEEGATPDADKAAGTESKESRQEGASE